MIIKDMLIPAIQNLSTTPFVWDGNYIGENILIPFILIVVLITMQLMFYLESKKTKKRKIK
jgi:hypothetical protein